MASPKFGAGVIIGKNVQFEENIVVWNFVVIGDDSKIGEGTTIGSFCDIGKNVQIGKRCSLQAHVTVSNGCIIEDDVFIAPNTTLLNDKYPRSGINSPVILRKGAVIGGGVTILPNVVVGENSVVGGGAVVTQEVPSNVVVKGVPARFAMAISEYRQLQERFQKE